MYHFLPVFDVSEACGLLLASPAQCRKLKHLPPFAFRKECDGKARWVAPGYDAEVIERLGAKACEACLTGTPCEAWKACDLAQFQPRRLDNTEMPERFTVEHVAPGRMSLTRALAVLGLAAESTEAEIKQAFSRAMLRAHPDHGGSSAQVADLLAARATIARR